MSIELPKYRCHKIVGALEIREAEYCNGYAMLHFVDAERHEPIRISKDMFARYRPGPGDYYVVYDDGYPSISPKAAFESGYSPVGAMQEIIEPSDDERSEWPTATCEYVEALEARLAEAGA